MLKLLAYLTTLIQYGHTPGRIGTVRIGRTVYAAGEFTTREMPHPVPVPAQRRIALQPLYRQDGREPVELLPPSYERSTRIHYVIEGRPWYVVGWNQAEGTLWLGETPSDSEHFAHYRDMQVVADWWPESYDEAMALPYEERKFVV